MILQILLAVFSTLPTARAARTATYIVEYEAAKADRVIQVLTNRGYRYFKANGAEPVMVIDGPPGIGQLRKIDGVVSVEVNRKVSAAEGCAGSLEE